jgi:hypothetical protein
MPQARWLRHSNGRLFRIPTGFPNSINKAIFSWLAAYFSGQSCVGGGRLKHTKSCSNPTNRVAAAVFPQQKSHRSVLADPCVFPHLSSSPDLRLISSAWPSQISPMTGFRQMQNLHAYSGGTVRDSHPVFYSLVVLLPHPQALKRNIYFRGEYTPIFEKSQPKNGIIAVKIVARTSLPAWRN